MNKMVSIIITTRSEEKNIAVCLESIKSQTYKNIEIIVVDNASTDNTKKIAKKFTKKVFDKGPERSAQRNHGAKNASGSYLLFLDADMVLTNKVIEDCVSLMNKNSPSMKAVVIPEVSYGEGFWAKCKILERSFYLGVNWIESARFFSKDVFVRIGGYDEFLTGPEDFDLPQRVKEKYGAGSVGRIKSFIRHNEGQLTLWKTLQKKYYYGIKMDEYRRKKHNAAYLSKQSSILARYGLFFSKPQQLFDDPLVGVGMILMKTAEMLALFLGFVMGIVTK